MSPKWSPTPRPLSSVQEALNSSEWAVSVNCWYKGALEAPGSGPPSFDRESYKNIPWRRGWAPRVRTNPGSDTWQLFWGHEEDCAWLCEELPFVPALQQTCQPPMGRLQSIPPGEPGNVLGVDMLGSFSRSWKGNRFVLIRVDYSSQFCGKGR